MGVTVKIAGEFDPRAFDQASARLEAMRRLAIKNSDTMAGAAIRAGDSWVKMGGKLDDIGKKMSALGSKLTTTVTLPIVAGLGMATKAAIDEEQEMALLSQALKKNAGATDEQVAATEKWITATQNATGIADGELRPALAILTRSTKDVGEAQKLMSTAMDISAARGIPLETVVKAVSKAHDGNVGALGRLGIAYKDSKGETLSFKDVMKNAIDTYGGAASTAADTTAGRMAILKAKLMDVAESIGTRLIPIGEKLVGFITRLVDKFDTLSPAQQDLIIKLALVAAAVGPVLMIVGKLTSGFGGLMKVAGTLLGALGEGGVAGALGVIGGAIGPVLAVVAALAAIAAVGYVIYQNWDKLRPTFEKLVATMQPAFETVKTTVMNAIGVIMPVVQKLAAELVPTIKAIVDYFIKAWQVVGPIVMPIITGIVKFIGQAIAGILNVVRAVMALIRGDWKGAWEAIKAAAVNIWNGIVALAKGVFEGLVKLLGVIWGAMRSAASAAFGLLVDAVKTAIGKAVGFVVGIKDKIVGAVKGAGTWLLNAGKAIIQGLWDGMKQLWSKVTGWIGGIGKWISDHKGPIEYDRKLLFRHGRAIIGGLGAGMQAEWPTVAGLIAGFTNELGGLGGGVGAPAFAGAGGGAFGGGSSLSIGAGAVQVNVTAAPGSTVEDAKRAGEAAAQAFLAKVVREMRAG